MGTIKTNSDLLQRIELRRDFVREKLLTHTVTKNGCWEYTGFIHANGYGKFKIYVNHFTPQKRTFAAHRIAYAFFNNVDPAELFVCHKCDNKKCMNPYHLFLGTAQDNMTDMVNKGRSMNQSGTANNNCKVDPEKVRKIIQRIKKGETNKSIGTDMGISHSTVSLIRLGKSWKDVANEMDYHPKACFKRKAS